MVKVYGLLFCQLLGTDIAPQSSQGPFKAGFHTHFAGETIETWESAMSWPKTQNYLLMTSRLVSVLLTSVPRSTPSNPRPCDTHPLPSFTWQPVAALLPPIPSLLAALKEKGQIVDVHPINKQLTHDGVHCYTMLDQ